MTICLSRDGCDKNNVSIGEILLMLAINNKVDLKSSEEELIKKGFITAERDSNLKPIGWRVTNNGMTVLNSVILDSDKLQESPDRLTELASKLKDIFPKGKKSGTNYYWAEGTALIIRRLRLFFKKYGHEYTDEQIIQAAEKYVKSFNGDYQYMKLLKYFIFKEKIGAGGEVEGESELVNYIENAGQEDDLKDNWTTTLS